MAKGDDPLHDLTNEEKTKHERDLRRKAREHFRAGKKALREQLMAQANEISRRKSKRAHQHGI